MKSMGYTNAAVTAIVYFYLLWLSLLQDACCCITNIVAAVPFSAHAINLPACNPVYASNSVELSSL